MDEEAKAKVIQEFPLFKNMDMWADPDKEKFENIFEQSIHIDQKGLNGLKKEDCEGYIRINNPSEFDLFFNSRFESGNLRQVFRIPREEDYETDENDVIPSFLPEEEQEILRKNYRKERAIRKAKEKEIRDKEEEERVERERLEIL